MSAAGVWLTEDGGATWSTGYTGLVPRYMPEEARAGTNALCVHNMHRAPTAPERLFMQFHGSVYRSDDAGSSWNEIAEGLPSGFGFPLAIDPADPDSAFVIPLTADADRVTPDGKVRVFETRDAGASWTARGDGLPGATRGSRSCAKRSGATVRAPSSASGSGLRAARCSEAPTPARPGRPWPPSGAGDERPGVVVIGPKRVELQRARSVSDPVGTVGRHG